MLEEIYALSWIDWVVTITGIIYVVLAAKENIWCWFWGFISCSFWAYADFYLYQLYADGFLQLFYAGMSAWGLWQWQFGTKGKGPSPIRKMERHEHIWIISLSVIGGILAGYFLSTYTDAAASYPDAITTVFAIMATYLVVQKKLENWLYWMGIDFVYLFIYGSQGAYLFVLIMVIYLVVAYYGWRNWERRYLAYT